MKLERWQGRSGCQIVVSIGLEFLALLLLNMGPSADYLDGLDDFKVARCGGDGDGVHMEYSILSWNYTE